MLIIYFKKLNLNINFNEDMNEVLPEFFNKNKYSSNLQ